MPPTVRLDRALACDAAISAAVAVIEIGGTLGQDHHLGHHVGLAGILLLAAGSATLVARRRHPVAVLAAAYAASFAYLLVQSGDGLPWFAVIVALLTCVAARRLAIAAGFVVAGYVALCFGPRLAGHHAPTARFDLILGAGLAVGMAGAEAVRLRRQRAAAVARSREEEARRRASEERLAMARDLHDVVAHSISAINVQANTALHLMDRQPERAREALVSINDVSRQALVELRSILGVLRRVDEGQPRSATPGLHALGDLLATAEAAGLRVEVLEEGPRPDLPPDVDVAAYRIVQEALTNAVRHSGGHSARVRLAYGEGDLEVEVTDDGTGANGSRPGNGIAGMTERARALGGTLQAGKADSGGFAVRARLPLPAS